jgi:hypothetical protein
VCVHAAHRDGGARASTSATASENAEYLQQQLHYTPEGDKLLDANGVVCVRLLAGLACEHG